MPKPNLEEIAQSQAPGENDLEEIAQSKAPNKKDKNKKKNGQKESIEGFVCSAARAYAVSWSIARSIPLICTNPLPGLAFAAIDTIKNYIVANLSTKIPFNFFKWATYPILHPITSFNKIKDFLIKNPLKTMSQILSSPIILIKNMITYPFSVSASSKKGQILGSFAGGISGSAFYIEPLYDVMKGIYYKATGSLGIEDKLRMYAFEKMYAR